MVRKIGNQERIQLLLIEGLFEKVPVGDRCPHLKKDNIGPYCSKDLKRTMISESRRVVCGNASLQLYCLDKSRFSKCIWYMRGGFEE